MSSRLKIGHIFKIPLSKSRHAYGQYIIKSRRGPIIRVFECISKKELKPEEIIKNKLMFSPIFIGLQAAVREGVFEIIGFSEIEKNLPQPKFKFALIRPDKSVACWYLVDGEKSIKLGPSLPKKYQNLERTGVWSAYDVIKRIENNGEIPYEAWK